MQTLQTAITRSITAIVCMALMPLFISAGNTSDPAAYRKIYLTPPGKKITATVALKAKPMADSRRIYYWLDHDNIQQTQGGYAGYLLSGEYTEFVYPGNQLLAKGSFDDGLMNGIWTRWYSNGFISEKATWKKGVLHGRKYYYNNSGRLVKTERYSNGRFLSEQAPEPAVAKASDSTTKETKLKHILTVVQQRLHFRKNK